MSKEWFGSMMGQAAAMVKQGYQQVNEQVQALSLDNLRERQTLQERGLPEEQLRVKGNFEGMDLTYISPRIIAMAFPVTKTSKTRRGNDAARVADFLRIHHEKQFMIWNLSEEEYDSQAFGQSVIEFHFPGYPAPPLGKLIKICTAMEGWIHADANNVAVVHCNTGHGRTAVAIACALAWLRRCPSPLPRALPVYAAPHSFDTPLEALSTVCELRGSSLAQYAVPSQRRYAQYFSSVLAGMKPEVGALTLRSVTIFGVPNMSVSAADARRMANGSEEEQRELRTGGEYRPCLQVYKAGRLVFSSLSALKERLIRRARDRAVEEDREEAEAAERGRSLAIADIPAVRCSAAAGERFDEAGPIAATPAGSGAEGAGAEEEEEEVALPGVVYQVSKRVFGDLIVRCRHVEQSGKRVTVWRAAFHTGYVLDGVLRLTKAHLDTAAKDHRWPEDAFVEIKFAPVKEGEAAASGAAGDEAGAELDQPTMDDQLLEADSPIWATIAQREANKARRDAAEREAAEEARRREEAAAARQAAAMRDATASADGGIDMLGSMMQYGAFGIGDDDEQPESPSQERPQATRQAAGRAEEEAAATPATQAAAAAAGGDAAGADEQEDGEGKDEAADLLAEIDELAALEQELGLTGQAGLADQMKELEARPEGGGGRDDGSVGSLGPVDEEAEAAGDVEDYLAQLEAEADE